MSVVAAPPPSSLRKVDVRGRDPQVLRKEAQGRGKENVDSHRQAVGVAKQSAPAKQPAPAPATTSVRPTEERLQSLEHLVQHL